ncbi:MAG: SpoIIIAH-like family protein [Eubacterium sp.]|nr:SpoIIIAH-like family protein [Eubacterium sp.]
MKRIFRKNQVIITALALLIAVAGYISYTQANTDTRESVAENQEAGNQEVSADGLLDISEEDLAAEIFTDTEAPEELASAEGQSDTTATGGDSTANTTETASGEDAAIPEEDASDAGTTVLTSADTSNVASQMKLTREQTRSKNKETLMEIINNENVTDAQKQDAIDQLEEMTEIAEKESAAENLLMAKGFTDVVVSITDEEADVVLNMGDATEAKRAQVEDIVKRKTGISAENIVITPITTK